MMDDVFLFFLISVSTCECLLTVHSATVEISNDPDQMPN